MNDKKLVELDQHIKDKIIEILTGQWLTRPEIFEKLPRLTKIEDVRLINNFIESQINEGIISKKIIGHRLSFGIFKKEDLEPGINNRSENEIKLKSKALLKNWSDTGLRVKVGKTIYIDPDSKKKVKPNKNVKVGNNYFLVIDGNDDFKLRSKENNWHGKGTQEDPYIVENLIIDGNSKKDGILIKNTDIWFILHECSVRSCKNFGISLENVKNCIIIKNRIVLNSGTGLILRNSSKIQVDNNYFLNNLIGIKISNSDLNEIKANEINTNSQSGIVIESSLNNNLVDNLYSYNGIGIDIKQSNNCIIKGCEIKLNKKIGLRLIDCSENEIIENMIIKNGTGIEIINSNVNQIHKNQIKFNQNDGIALFNSYENLIEMNMAIKNKCGIYLDRCAKNIIKNNLTEYNQENGIYLFQSYENEVA
ncbi:MAG: right-handed parallel beta-helix repeat-containing protein [Candidatus Helarchaeota archaeon]